MNDVGTGYSSLSYLRRCSFDRIKIDQSFVRDMGSKQDCGAIIRAVVGLSSELGAATTGRGGRRAGSSTRSPLAGCTEVQGYLFTPRHLPRPHPSWCGSLPRCGEGAPSPSRSRPHRSSATSA
jgi:EAL domain-containing protein (putative c-di-GMP-specific phosphodiesterase class I)